MMDIAVLGFHKLNTQRHLLMDQNFLYGSGLFSYFPQYKDTFVHFVICLAGTYSTGELKQPADPPDGQEHILQQVLQGPCTHSGGQRCVSAL